MENEYISVIIPTYNRAHLIMRAINSVLEQTYPYFELLIVDDGSTDNTREVIEHIKDDRIRYICCEENGGPAKARNIGIEQSVYDYIAFQDSDDEWLLDKLEKQMKVMQATDEKVGVVYGAYFYQGIDGKQSVGPTLEIPLAKKSGNVLEALLETNIVAFQCSLIKKACLLEVGGFDSNLKCIEDYELALRLAEKCEMIFMDEIVNVIYATEGSVTVNMSGYFTSYCYIIAKYKKQFLAYDKFNSTVEMLINKAEQFGYKDQVVQCLEKMLSMY